MAAWSKLQKQIYNLMDPEINFQIRCSVYRMDSQQGSTNLPRYWVTLNQEILFDYPKEFIPLNQGYPYLTSVSVLSDILREYIDTPLAELLYHPFERDIFGMTPLLKSADRRIGRKKLEMWAKEMGHPGVMKIIEARFKMPQSI